MGTSWKAYAAASVLAFALMLATVVVAGTSSYVVRLTEDRVHGYAYVGGVDLVVLATDEGLEAFRLDGSPAWSVPGDRACAVSPSPKDGVVAAHVGMEILLVRASDGVVTQRLRVGTICVSGASLVWGPGGDTVIGNTGLERVVVANTSDGYAAQSNWLGIEVKHIKWLNRTHALIFGHGYGKGMAYVIRADPLTLEENITFRGRGWLVGDAVVVLEPEGRVWEWVPGKGVVWETDLGSQPAAADMGNELLFALTQDFRVVAINVSDGSVAWEARLECIVPEGTIPPPYHFSGDFVAGGDAVAMTGIIFGINGSCLTSGIYREGRNILLPRIEHFLWFDDWLDNKTAVIDLGIMSAIVDVTNGIAEPLNGAYITKIPGGGIIVKRGESYTLLRTNGYALPLPNLGDGSIVGLTPTRVLIIRSRGADLLVIGSPDKVMKTLIAGLGLGGAGLATLAYRAWRAENRVTRKRPPKKSVSEAMNQ